METTEKKTAKIYAFPLGGRSGKTSSLRMDRTAQKPVVATPTIDYGACWYHGDAMAKAERTKKH